MLLPSLEIADLSLVPTGSYVVKEDRDSFLQTQSLLLNKRIQKLFFQSGADPSARNNDDKTVAHYTAESGRCDILKVVLEHGCDVKIADK